MPRFQRKYSIGYSRSKCTPNSDKFVMLFFPNSRSWIFRAPNAVIKPINEEINLFYWKKWLNNVARSSSRERVDFSGLSSRLLLNKFFWNFRFFSSHLKNLEHYFDQKFAKLTNRRKPDFTIVIVMFDNKEISQSELWAIEIWLAWKLLSVHWLQNGSYEWCWWHNLSSSIHSFR